MLIIILAHLPIFTLQRHEGRIFAPMAYTVTSALVGALLFSLTLVPLLCFYLLRRDVPEHENLLVRVCKRLYRPLLVGALGHPKTVLVTALLALAFSLALVPHLGSEFLPELNEGTLWVNIMLPPSISVSETSRLSVEAARQTLDLAYAQRHRDIDVALEYQRIGSDNTVGTTVSFPLFLSHKFEGQITQGLAQVQQAQVAFEQTKLQGLTEVEKAYQAYQASWQVLQVYTTEALAKAEASFHIASVSYRQGARSLLELQSIASLRKSMATGTSHTVLAYNSLGDGLCDACPLQGEGTITRVHNMREAPGGRAHNARCHRPLPGEHTGERSVRHVGRISPADRAACAADPCIWLSV
jgi:multidrug efflux pump subunit AcrB